MDLMMLVTQRRSQESNEGEDHGHIKDIILFIARQFLSLQGKRRVDRTDMGEEWWEQLVHIALCH